MTEPSPDVWRALAAYVERPGPRHSDVCSALGLRDPDPAAHTETFVMNLYPYASVWVGAEGMLGGAARERVAGFWRAVGLMPPSEPDHLCALLELYATLAELEQRESGAENALRRRARTALLWEHLLSWMGPWLDELKRISPDVYAPWAGLLWMCLTDAARKLGPLDELPRHLRDGHEPVSEKDGLDAQTASVLASGRSGMIVTRHTLSRAAADTGLGLRIGERAFTLKALFGQDPGATTMWLRDEARRWVARHAAMEPDLGEVAAAWRTRAEATGTALDAALASA